MISAKICWLLICLGKNNIIDHTNHMEYKKIWYLFFLLSYDRLMDKLWKKSGLELVMTHYNIIATGNPFPSNILYSHIFLLSNQLKHLLFLSFLLLR